MYHVDRPHLATYIHKYIILVTIFDCHLSFWLVFLFLMMFVLLSQNHRQTDSGIRTAMHELAALLDRLESDCLEASLTSGTELKGKCQALVSLLSLLLTYFTLLLAAYRIDKEAVLKNWTSWMALYRHFDRIKRFRVWLNHARLRTKEFQLTECVGTDFSVNDWGNKRKK